MVYPIIHRVSTIQGGAGFLPSTVCQQQSSYTYVIYVYPYTWVAITYFLMCSWSGLQTHSRPFCWTLSKVVVSLKKGSHCPSTLAKITPSPATTWHVSNCDIPLVIPPQVENARKSCTWAKRSSKIHGAPQMFKKLEMQFQHQHIWNTMKHVYFRRWTPTKNTSKFAFWDCE